MRNSSAPARELQGAIRFSCEAGGSAVRRAAADLAADFHRVLGAEPILVSPGEAADLAARLAPPGALAVAESWRIRCDEQGVLIEGADELGLVFGLYEFSRRFLGVDPLWFWKSLPPLPRHSVAVPHGTLASEPPRFRYRGWFINDEDLLTEFRPPSGRRRIEYPFYQQVMALTLFDRVLEALLRLGGNLIIPASFLDVMNPPEAALARRAAERGLYVSQHHVEPLGVSHFAYENWWRDRGAAHAFSYSGAPGRLREVWRAYALRWRELAGDRVIWQIGLRGRGDHPVWTADSGITPETGGRFISEAMADQLAIIREVDPRPDAPVTTTLFLEGSPLMASGALRIPEGVTVVFADDGNTQRMQADFHSCPRVPGRAHGLYYHAAFWRRGPHLLPGADPRRMIEVLREVEAKGDTHYAILNVSNVREHVLGAHVFARATLQGAEIPARELLAGFGPPELLALLDDYHAAFVRRADGSMIQDGDCNEGVVYYITDRIGTPQRPHPREWTDAAALRAAATRLDEVAVRAEAMPGEERFREFARVYLAASARSLGRQYEALAALIEPGGPDLLLAAARLEAALDALAPRAEGDWDGWYRGERKAGWRGFIARLRAAACSADVTAA